MFIRVKHSKQIRLTSLYSAPVTKSIAFGAVAIPILIQLKKR